MYPASSLRVPLKTRPEESERERLKFKAAPTLTLADDMQGRGSSRNNRSSPIYVEKQKICAARCFLSLRQDSCISLLQPFFFLDVALGCAAEMEW